MLLHGALIAPDCRTARLAVKTELKLTCVIFHFDWTFCWKYYSHLHWEPENCDIGRRHQMYLILLQNDWLVIIIFWVCCKTAASHVYWTIWNQSWSLKLYSYSTVSWFYCRHSVQAKFYRVTEQIQIIYFLALNFLTLLIDIKVNKDDFPSSLHCLLVWCCGLFVLTPKIENISNFKQNIELAWAWGKFFSYPQGNQSDWSIYF